MVTADPCADLRAEIARLHRECDAHEQALTMVEEDNSRLREAIRYAAIRLRELAAMIEELTTPEP